VGISELGARAVRLVDALVVAIAELPTEQSWRQIVHRMGRSEFAFAVSGATSRKEQSYRTVFRNLQRYEKTGGRMPKLSTLQRYQALARIIRQPLLASITGIVGVSSDRRERYIPDVLIGLRAVQRFLKLWGEARYEESAARFEDAFWDSYGVPGAHWEDVTDMTLEPE
jgi:hypothetical protein